MRWPADARAAVEGGEALSVRASATLRPLLLAALLEDERGLAGRPGAAGQPRRPLGPRPGRRPARLPGSAPGPLLPLARHRLRLPRQPAAASGRPAHRRARRAAPRRRRDRRRLGHGPRRGRARTPSCARPASRSRSARRSSSTAPPATWSPPATSGSSRSRSAASSPCAAASSTSSRRPRSAPCGSSSSATRSSRCAGSRPSPSARWATPRRSSSRRRPSSTPSTAKSPSWPRWRRRRRAARRPSLAEALPLERFGAPLDLVPESAAVVLAAPEEIEPALRDHWEDATTSMHADDARHLYVDVAEPLAERAALSLTGAGEDDEDAFRASRAESPARSIKEAEGELQKLVNSGYRTVVAFDSLGEAERTRYGLDRLDTSAARRRRPLARARPHLRRGAPARGLRQPRAEDRRLPLPPARPPPAPRRGARPGRRPRRGSPSATCGSATSSSTRTTASPASPASRLARSAASPATTSTSNTRARTASTSPPTSSPS